MPKLASVKRKSLIHYFRQLGFEGPFSGGKHDFMKRENRKVWIPNPHKSDISRDFLLRILKQAGIDREQWEEL